MRHKKELCKPILIPEVLGRYEVSSLGNIKSLPKERVIYSGKYISKAKIMKLTTTYRGYLNVTLSNLPFNKSFFAHILVARHFIENPLNLPQVNHKNGVKNDNRIENLEWCTQLDNIRHSYLIGLRPKKRILDCKSSRKNNINLCFSG